MFGVHQNNSKLKLVLGDIRDINAFENALEDCDAVIHLACISNDPSFDLAPDLGRSINFDCFEPLVSKSKALGIKRFIYASSSSVYGVKNHPQVIETDSLEPLTDYSIFKAKCEQILLQYRGNKFVTTTIRPATVCGYSPRQRLDVVVNILTNLAYNRGKITVFGGEQLRPNIHIVDMCRIYLLVLALMMNRSMVKYLMQVMRTTRLTNLQIWLEKALGRMFKLKNIQQMTIVHTMYHLKRSV